jgi:hypothetical protein
MALKSIWCDYSDFKDKFKSYHVGYTAMFDLRLQSTVLTYFLQKRLSPNARPFMCYETSAIVRHLCRYRFWRSGGSSWSRISNLWRYYSSEVSPLRKYPRGHCLSQHLVRESILRQHLKNGEMIWASEVCSSWLQESVFELGVDSTKIDLEAWPLTPLQLIISYWIWCPYYLPFQFH